MSEYQISIGPKLAGKIPAGSPYWREFNGAFENQQLNRRQFASLIYMGHPFTTWHKAHWRDSKNFLLGHHLGVDFDTEDERSDIPHLLEDSFIRRYAGIIYTTPSHRPEAPRARVVFLLDTPIQQAKNYCAAAAALLWLFGSADRQCKDAVRFFYGAGENADIELLAGVLPLLTIKDMIARYQATGQQERKRVQQYTATNADEKEVQLALSRINPWGISYDQWLAILMAIHSEFPGTNGLALAESWAQGKAGEVAAKWRGFSPEGNAAGRVSISTLFALAMENGYKAH